MENNYLEGILGNIIQTDEDETALEKISHEHWCLLYFINLLNKLVDMGIMTSGNIDITEKGKRLLDIYWDRNGTLRDDGSKGPSNKEIELAGALAKWEGII